MFHCFVRNQPDSLISPASVFITVVSLVNLAIWCDGFLWVSVGLCVFLWVSVGLCGSLWVSVGVCLSVSVWVCTLHLFVYCGACERVGYCVVAVDQWSAWSYCQREERTLTTRTSQAAPLCTWLPETGRILYIDITACSL